MHEHTLLVPFQFDRIEYDLGNAETDMLDYRKQDFSFHYPSTQKLMEKTRKTNEDAFKDLSAATSKFEQVINNNRTGYFAEVAQREFYGIYYTLATQT